MNISQHAFVPFSYVSYNIVFLSIFPYAPLNIVVSAFPFESAGLYRETPSSSQYSVSSNSFPFLPYESRPSVNDSFSKFLLFY